MNPESSRIILIGDSITAEFDVAKYLPSLKIVNKGVSGDSTSETLERISPTWFKPEPDLIFICIGTNDLARNRSHESVIDGIRRIIQKIRSYAPASGIFLTSLFPTRDNIPRPNSKIIVLNEKLKSFSDIEEIGYFEIFQYFIDSQGMLKMEYTDDGLHLTESAYREWAQRLSEFISLIIIK